MKKSNFCILSLLLATTFLLGCANQTVSDNTDVDTDTEQRATTVISNVEVESSRIEVEDKDAPRSGSYVGGVVVSQETKLRPVFYKSGSSFFDSREECEERVSNGNFTEDCPTDTILTITRSDGKPFPKQFLRNKQQPKQDGPDEMVIGCYNETTYYTAPMRNFTGGFSSVISHDDQQILMQAGSGDLELDVSISKKAYDLLERGTSNCDIYFTNLKVMQ